MLTDQKVAIITPWRYRDHFVPIYNEIWSKQNYSNYDIHIFEEQYTLKIKTNKFNETFNIHPIMTNNRMSIGAKLNYAFDTLVDKYDYIMIASSDDYYGPQYIKTCLEFIKNNNLDFINMKEANYINIKNMSIAQVNTSASYSGMFFFKSELSKKYRWNESLRSAEDRFMLNTLKKSGIKCMATNIHQSSWLGIIHSPVGGEKTGNWNTKGFGWDWKSADSLWFKNYLNNNDTLFNLYTTILG